MRRHNYIRSTTLHRKLKDLTCIIGAKCAEGTVIISDTRVMRDLEATIETKLHRFWDGNAVIATAGSTVVSDYLVDDLKQNESQSGISSFNQLTKNVEDSVYGIKSRYFARMGESFNIELLVSGLDEVDKGEPVLKRMYQNSVSENVNKFAIIGHGAPYATTLFGLMFDMMLTIKETALLGYFVISTIIALGYDQSVGVDNSGPEVVFIKDDEKPEYMDTSTKEFERTKSVAKSLDFKNKLVRSIWENTPQAYSLARGID